MPDLRKNVEIPFEQVVPIKPEIGDTVIIFSANFSDSILQKKKIQARVIFGDEMGAVGELISSEGTGTLIFETIMSIRSKMCQFLRKLC